MFVEVAVTFVGKGSLAVRGRLFKTAKVGLYCCWACRGLYEFSCHRSLALVKGEGEASRACTGGVCVDRACVDRACADKACVGGACTDKACMDGACVGGACVDRVCVGEACVNRAAY
jgi:hypothetical protein